MSTTTGVDHGDVKRDFDIFSDEYIADPSRVWDELRTECPVAHSERNGGGWMPTTWDDIAAVAYDTDNFSSRDSSVALTPEGASFISAPPITSDPPFHGDARRMLLPFFSPKAVEELVEVTRSIARERLDIIAAETGANWGGSGVIDAADAFSKYIPVRVIARILGLPESDEPMFTRWAVAVLQATPEEHDHRALATREVLKYFGDLVDARREERADDLPSKLIDIPLPNGDPLTNRHIIGVGFLLLLAGIDTTWSSISASLLHLATHPDDRERLLAEPELLDSAIEEFLRAYAPVTMARISATDEAEISGCPVPKGDKVYLPFGASNRDPAMFDRPDEVLIDRAHNRHVAFGIGIHRCLGSNLARMELKVALEEWLARFPNFELATDADGRSAEWGGSQIRGPRNLQIRVGI